MIDILIFIAAIVVHELGHYIAFRIYGYNPSISFKAGGIIIGNNCIFKMNNRQVILTSALGIAFGAGPLIIYGASCLTWLVYIFCSSQDSSILLNLLGQPLENNYVDVYRQMLESAERIRDA